MWCAYLKRGAVFAIMLATAPAWACVVDIDVKPGMEPNVIDLAAECELEVAMLAEYEGALDYANPGSSRTRLAADHASRDSGAIPLWWEWSDVDDDGDMDLLFGFSIDELAAGGALSEEATELSLIVYGEWDVYWPEAACKYDNMHGTDAVEVVVQPLTIGDLVWMDANGDGIQDADEPGIADVGLTL